MSQAMSKFNVVIFGVSICSLLESEIDHYINLYIDVTHANRTNTLYRLH